MPHNKFNDMKLEKFYYLKSKIKNQKTKFGNSALSIGAELVLNARLHPADTFASGRI